MEYSPKKEAVVKGFAKANMWFWEDVYDRNKMLLAVYESKEYISRFGDHDLHACLKEMANAKWHIEDCERRMTERE